MNNVLVTGAAGFIGSHLVDRLLDAGNTVVGVDNLVRGREENLRRASGNPRFRLVRADLANSTEMNAALDALAAHLRFDAAWHMAANSDIAAGVADPRIDLRDTFMTTFNLLEFMRRHRIPRLAFASSSAIYGVLPGRIAEDAGPLFPISNYGAMKLAGEAVISAALESFLERAVLFRFPNVVGSRGTHGVIYDLMRKLQGRPDHLAVLGDGTQRKPYLHVSELLNALLHIWTKAPERLAFYNIGPEDAGVTVSAIAQEVLDATGSNLPIRYSGGDRGWVGDVPRFEYSTAKLQALGWRPSLGSHQAIAQACIEIAAENALL